MMWKVVSTYTDGERIVEGIFTTEDIAKGKVELVGFFREDQDEAPIVTVEKIEP